MKFKYSFALILLMTIILSLGTVAASENIDYNANSSDSTYSSVDNENQCLISALDAGADDGLENQNSDNNLIKDHLLNSSPSDEVDLCVDMELGDIKRETFAINTMTFEIPLIITVSVNNGTAHNVKVYNNIPDDFIYLSSDATTGKYDVESGIWDIGDVDSTSNATLTILVKLEKRGTFFIFVNATTDSNDIDLSNNDLECTITADMRILSNTTRTSANQGGANHGPRGNNHGPKFINRVDETASNQNQESGNGEGSNTNNGENNNNGEGSNTNNGENNNNGEGTNTNNGENNNNRENNNNGEGSNTNNRESDNSETVTAGLAKSTRSLNYAISETLASLSSLFNPNSTDYNLTPDVVKAISAQDYTKIPILIFIVFLIVVLCLVAYGKIKP